MRELTMKLTRRILMGAAAGSFLLSGTAPPWRRPS